VNDRRFIELLNLYLDHQISAEEAGELESEVMHNPARRRTYNQYCRLQRGCSLLGERERSNAPASAEFARSLREAERKIAAPRRTSWWSTPAYAGAFAASAMAACVAVVVVVNNRVPADSAPLAGSIAAVEQPAAVAASIETPSAVLARERPVMPVRAASIPSFETQPVLATSGFSVARNSREAEIAANDRDVREWMQRVEQAGVVAIVVDDQAFETRPTLHQDNRVFRSRHGIQGNAEFAAFQFQR
jgi:anti-sigma factor RsiW